MIHEQILEQLEQFAAGQLSDQRLEDWVLSHLQEILDSKNMRAIDLANELDALFVQQTEGLRSHEELMSALLGICAREKASLWIDIGEPPVQSVGVRTVYKVYGEPQATHTFTGLTNALVTG